MPSRSVDPQTGDAAVSTITATELGAHLQASLGARCDELHEAFLTSRDALALLESVARPSEHVIRRLPAKAQRILAAARADNASIGRLVDLVSSDPVIIRGLLRLANSTAYAGVDRPAVTSIVDALRRVGSTGVESVVLRCLVEGMFCLPGGEYQGMADQIWAHMVRAAPIGRVLGGLFGLNPDEAFLLAMMHDVGKLVVFDRIGALRTAQRRDLQFPPDFISEVLRAVHEPLGGIAALEWGMGDVAAAAIASHHRTETYSFSDRESQLVYAVERIDLARSSGRPIDADAWIVEGRLSVTGARIAATLDAKPH